MADKQQPDRRQPISTKIIIAILIPIVGMLAAMCITFYTTGARGVEAEVLRNIKARVDSYEVEQRKDQGKFLVLSSYDASVEATMKAFAGSIGKVEEGVDKLIDLMQNHIEDHP